MNIELHEIPIRDVVEGYSDREEEGVYGMDGQLNIRPIYQREFIYKDKQRDAVIDTVRNSFPLNVLYWVQNKDETYEVLDGQQRVISISQYVSGIFSINWPDLGNVYFHNLANDQQDQILNYKLMVYFCEGSDSERLSWFRTINIAGEKLTEQETRNAIFAGPWISNAKRYFSKTGGPAYEIAADYLKGSAIRQEYLETAIKWFCNSYESKNIEELMGAYQNLTDAAELWEYFENVIEWTKRIFPQYRKEMKGVSFGLLFNDYQDKDYDTNEVENKVRTLMEDEDVTKKSGIYSYIFTRNEKDLNIRYFNENQRRQTYESQQGICIHCQEKFNLEQMEADHITPWCQGGKTIIENCQMLCKSCNRTKSSN